MRSTWHQFQDYEIFYKPDLFGAFSGKFFVKLFSQPTLVSVLIQVHTQDLEGDGAET